MTRIVAVITARGGSRGFPGKNLAMLAGKPLIAHTIIAALDCPQVGRTLVTTDDAAIAAVAREYGAEVVDRPAALATDTARSADAVLHALDVLAGEGDRPDWFVLLQPTCPLRTRVHVSECIARLQESGAACAISVTGYRHHPYKGFKVAAGLLDPLYGVEYLERPRQSLDVVVAQNGAMYVMGPDTLRRRRSFYAPPALAYEMPPEASVDIDDPADLAFAEFCLARQASDNHPEQEDRP